MATLLETQKLSKLYPGSQTPALHELSIKVSAGEVYGYLGANGAGKSTTIRLLMNFLQPSGGSAQICGLDVVRDTVKIKQHVGYLAGDVALPSKVTARELLDYLASLHRTDVQSYRKQLEKRFEAETNKPIAELSKGNRQKIGIIQALMHQPDVLILDEPTSGLDPLMQEVFYETIREARSRGVAVLMSSHNLAEAQGLCDRIGIIKHGKLIREQTVDNDATLDRPIFRIVLSHRKDADRIKTLHNIKIVSQTPDVFVVQPNTSISAALRDLGTLELKSIRSEQATLEDEFLEFYGSKA